MTKWIKVTEARYWEMLEVLPPEAQTGFGFLVGEATDHNAQGRPRFAAFVEVQGQFFESAEPMTIADFKAIKLSEVLAQQNA